MTSQFHPSLVNDPFDDPAVYVDFLYERRALLFDLGDIRALSPRKILRITHIFISHTHIDHFIGFSQVLRLCLGREKRLHLFGPPGFIAQVEHSLASFTWNLVESYPTDFTVVAVELYPDDTSCTVEFHCRSGFRRERERTEQMAGGIVLDEDGFRIRAAFLDHKTVSLAFALEEKDHVNIMKNRLLELGLPTGHWLADLKRAIMRGEDDDKPFRVSWLGETGTKERHFTMGELKTTILNIVPGQRIAYVTDAANTPENAAKIIDLARGADVLFIEAAFLDADHAQAAERYHLTARQAGLLARQAGVARVIPFHFSPRYQGMEEALLKELGP
ncbi:MAG: MBL fold metallo-hydrolase [Oryzomonas sp.]|uniref:ribonuclease Z n=1 Tax=Oryzomonas sp. TaxID=2855186 RepID=UPI002842AF4B|nr:MBL fold metallo-hydrolase [Oryzomonas sp.]MDR3578916.1 MBL fold metallo-hydrolase [Oryzomonas sp.]